MVVDSQNNLNTVGAFAYAGSLPVQNVAKWDGSQWEVLGSGLNDYATATAIDNQGRLVGAEKFTVEGGVQAPGLARWNGQSWKAIFDEQIFHTNVLFIVGDAPYGGGS